MTKRSSRKNSQIKTKEKTRTMLKSAGLTLDKREFQKKITYLEELNNSLLEQISTSVLLVDRRLKVIFANRNFYLKTRKDPSLVIDKPIKEVFSHPFIWRTKLISKVQEVIEQGVMQEGEIRWSGYVYHYKIFPLKNGLRENHNAIFLLDDITREKYLVEEVKKM